MNPEHERLTTWDAAYVLGALSTAERNDFERHLRDCERCREAVAELAALPGLLARARGALDPAAASLEPVPPTDLAERVVRLDARRRRTMRTRVGLALAGAAATVAVMLGVVGVLTRAPAADVTAALEPVGASSLTASVDLDAVPWGTRLTMTCTYGETATGYGAQTYVLVVTDDAGVSTSVSTWTAEPGQTVVLEAGTAVPLESIASVSVQDASGDAVLEGTVSS